jgi:hypothetical protein
MRTAAIALAVAAFLLAPVTVFALLRPTPAPLERIVYIVPMESVNACTSAPTWRSL